MKLFAIGLVSALLLLTDSVLAADTVPAMFTASYSVSKGNLALGKIQRALSTAENGHYYFVSVTEPTGLAAAFTGKIEERSLWSYQDHQIRPLHYEKAGDKKSRNLNLVFDWPGAIVKNTPEDNVWELPLSPGTQDTLSYQIAIMYDLQQGKTDLSYLVVDKRKLKTYRFALAGEETLNTPLGSLSTLKIQRTDSAEKITVLWCAPDLDYLPIRIEQSEKGGEPFSMTLISVEGLRAHPGQ
jgi:hypothetical protein